MEDGIYQVELIAVEIKHGRPKKIVFMVAEGEDAGTYFSVPVINWRMEEDK